MSNPLYRWKLKHGKLNKSVKRKVVTVTRRMARKRRSYPRRFLRRFRRRTPKRFSILTGVGIAAGTMTSLNDRYSIYQSVTEKIPAIMAGNKQAGADLAADLMTQTIGYDPRDKVFKLPTFTALMLGGAIASKLFGKFVKPGTFDSIPMIGKKLKL